MLAFVQTYHEDGDDVIPLRGSLLPPGGHYAHCVNQPAPALISRFLDLFAQTAPEMVQREFLFASCQYPLFPAYVDFCEIRGHLYLIRIGVHLDDMALLFILLRLRERVGPFEEGTSVDLSLASP